MCRDMRLDMCRDMCLDMFRDMCSAICIGVCFASLNEEMMWIVKCTVMYSILQQHLSDH